MEEPATTMTSLRRTLLSICLLPALATGLAQQTPVKPASGAKPAAAPAINHPATSSTTARSAAAAPAAHSANVTANYIIGAEDTLQITVWQEPNLSTPALPVRPDGKISLPLVGDITAAGFTPMQLAADIGNRLRQYVTDPEVDVTVLAVNSKRVYLIGEVMHVGPLAITPGMTVLQAIATAGGLTPYANKKHIYILRGDRQQKIPFDYTLAVKKGDMQGVSLVPGDTIVVP
jgi:polysaccharide export outer membrane protein